MGLDDTDSQRTGLQLHAAFNTSASELRGCQGLRLVTKHEAARILGISPETLKKYRLQPGSSLIEGIHYHVWNRRTVRYNPDLIADWAVNRNHPEQHQTAVDAYLASLPSHQPTQGRRAS